MFACRYRYFGAISRSDAKSLLEDTADGTFLVRIHNDPSSGTNFILSVKSVASAIYCSILCHRLTPPSRLSKPVSNVRPYVVHPSVCPSTKCFFDFNGIWCVGRGRLVMHDSMQYDPIQGNEPLKVRNSTIFKGYPIHL